MNIKIGSKIFLNSDQKEFAEASKDYNKIHIDGIISRKLIFGSQIVHGVNTLLTALIFLSITKKNIKIKNISCNFYKPIYLKKKINFYLNEKNNEYYIYVKSGNIVNSIFHINKLDLQLKLNIKYKNYKKNIIKKINVKNILNHDCNLNFANKFFLIKSNNFKTKNRYKKLLNILSDREIKDILSLSFFVGMVCPGKYSLLAKINLNFEKKQKVKCNDISFFINKFDKRINRVEINFSNSITGKIFAFKYNVSTQEDLKNIKAKIKNKFLKTKKSIIIGGSRGLGELTSKILSSAGSDTLISYNYGINEAKKLKSDVIKFTKTKCKIMQINILNENNFSKLKKENMYDFLFYYATPKINISNIKKFDSQLFKKFNDFYIFKFSKLCRLLNKISNKKIKIFFPSTIFLNYKENYFKEYVLSKKMAERNIKYLNKKLHNIKIISYRLPIMDTDQNINVIKKKKINNFKVLFSIIKKFIKNENN
jgi:hypothetical protein